MKKFSEFRVGDKFVSTCSISEDELDEYFRFSRVKNAFLEDYGSKKQQLVSGRAALSRMEGEFTRLSQIYGNHIIFIGTDGDPEWENRSTRFLKPVHTDEVLKLQYTVSGKEDIDDEYGKLAIDYEGINQEGETVLISRKNIYRIKKEPPR
ncbi:MAG: hypothetical protein GTN35_03705 [Nitrososphaeria archaeon]|nr:hypothetical protein [Nitrosopumilaceae archaeon]NIP10124.1 hypothetical protein [Nitrosopumilaceae archaeon]NIP91488.1 hypothetical protein [Nitrososphaeria archaeon]NIS95323.1 hypothetical protein [Nitrosopumilaceae archaeon]